MTPYIILVTTPSEKVATRIARCLVEKRLVACVNIIPRITSLYRWQNKLCQDKESLMIIKTRRSLFRRVERAIKEMHPYEVPEIIGLPITQGNRAYLNWLDSVTR